MNATKLIAARAFERALRSNPQRQAQQEAARCDSAFDGGEWSGPFHDRAEQALWDAIEARVADRFGMTAVELSNAHRAWCEDSLQGMIEGRDPRPMAVQS